MPTSTKKAIQRETVKNAQINQSSILKYVHGNHREAGKLKQKQKENLSTNGTRVIRHLQTGKNKT